VSDRVESLSLPERIEVYRQRAARMLRLARQCESQGVRLAYLKLAAHWQDLIVEMGNGRAVPPEQVGKIENIEPSRPVATKGQ